MVVVLRTNFYKFYFLGYPNCYSFSFCNITKNANEIILIMHAHCSVPTTNGITLRSQITNVKQPRYKYKQAKTVTSVFIFLAAFQLFSVCNRFHVLLFQYSLRNLFSLSFISGAAVWRPFYQMAGSQHEMNRVYARIET